MCFSLENSLKKTYNTLMLKEQLSKAQYFVKEREKRPSLEFIDLTEPSYGEFGMLAEDVKRSGGKATVIVHPFYHKRGDGVGLHPLYKHRLRGIAAASLKQGVPLIVFEEAASVEMLRERLPEGNISYLIQTVPGDPAPLIQEVSNSDGYKFSERSEEVELDKISQRMFDAGVREVSIAGRYYYEDHAKADLKELQFNKFRFETEHNSSAHKWIEKELCPHGCVGGVIQSLLRQNIRVNLTNAVSPNGRMPSVRAFSKRNFSF